MHCVEGLAERSSDSSMELINCDSTSADVLPSVIMYQDLLIFKKAQKIAVEVRIKPVSIQRFAADMSKNHAVVEWAVSKFYC